MRVRCGFNSVLLGMCWLLLFPVAALAAPGQGEKIAVVDTLHILNNSQALQEVQKKFSEHIQADQAYISTIESKFRDLDQKMADELQKINQTQMSPEAKEVASTALIAKRHEHDHQVVQLQELVEKRKEYLDEVFSKAKMQVHQALMHIVEDVARISHYTMVVNRAQVVYTEAGRDLTEVVSAQLNQDLPTLSLTVESLADFKSPMEAESDDGRGEGE